MSVTVNDLVSVGFGPDWAQDALSRFGEHGLELLREAVVTGLSVQLVIQAVEAFGTDGLQLLVAFLKWKLNVAAGATPGCGAGAAVPPEGVALLQDGTVGGAGGFLVSLLVAYLRKKAPELTEKLLDALIEGIK